MKLLPFVYVVAVSISLIGCGKSKEQIEAEEAAAARALALAQEAKEAAEKAAKIAELRELLLASLKDPGSAQFTNLTLKESSAGKVLCGQVNAKNSYGGYVGARPFAVTERPVYNTDNSRVFLLSSPNEIIAVMAHKVTLSNLGCPTTGM